MAKIYVASSWRNQYQQDVVKKLRELGHEVYDFQNPPQKSGFSWSKIDPNWKNWTTEQYKEALQNPLAKSGFKSDFDAMHWAGTCVLVLPCGRSAHAEAGWMKGARKHVVAYIPEVQEPELMYKMFDDIVTSMDEFEKVITKPGVCRKCGCTLYDPCWSPHAGYCGWNDQSQTLCTHCAVEVIRDDPRTQHCVNSKPRIIPVINNKIDRPYVPETWEE